MKYTLITALALSSALLGSCTGGQSKATEATDVSEVSLSSAPFVADSAYQYIKEQVAFGVRTPGSPGHKQCGDWIESKLVSLGYNVSSQHFPGQDYFGKQLEGRNIIASLSPDKTERILLMAHWDTRPVADEDSNVTLREKAIDGADDGASGVAVLLELARQWSIKQPNIGIDIILFDQEDGGHSGKDNSWCLGSQYWSKNPHIKDYTAKAGILLDMVGARSAKFHWESFSKAYAAPLLTEIWAIAKDLGHISYFPQSEGGAVIDDHVPVIENRKIPCVDIVNFSLEGNHQGFGEHWHTSKDNISIIDKATLQAVGETVATYISKQ